MTFFFIFTLAFISCTTKTAAVQDKETNFQKKETIYEVWTVNGYEVKKLDTQPVLKGGEMATRSLYIDFRYPADARENGVEGRVEILVEVNEFGMLESMELIKGIGLSKSYFILFLVFIYTKVSNEPPIFNG